MNTHITKAKGSFKNLTKCTFNTTINVLFVLFRREITEMCYFMSIAVYAE